MKHEDHFVLSFEQDQHRNLRKLRDWLLGYCKSSVRAYEQGPDAGVLRMEKEPWGRYLVRCFVGDTPEMASFLFDERWPDSVRQCAGRINYALKYGVPIEFSFADRFTKEGARKWTLLSAIF